MLAKQLSLVRKYGLKEFLRGKIQKAKYVLNILKFHPNEREKWNSLYGRYSGERVFLIGNGPSLNKTPLFLLKNEKVMCFNHFYLMLEKVSWRPEFYTIVDNLVLDDIVKNIDVVLNNSKEVFMPSVHVQGDVFITKVKENDQINWFRHYIFGAGFSKKLPKIYGGGTVIYEGFQILKYLGFSEIIMIGVDMNYQIHKSVKSIKKNSKT